MKPINQHQQAIHALEQKIAAIPDHGEACHHIDKLFYQGVLFLLKENLDAAETCFLEILAQDETHTDARCNLGVIALKKEENQKAITYFSETLGFDEKHEYARNNLAATFIHHHRFENALTHYTVLLKDYPHHPEYLYNAGVAEMALGHLNKARHHFLSVLQQNQNHAPSLTNLASIAMRLNHTHEAIHYLEAAINVNPDDQSAIFMRDALTERTPSREHAPQYTKHLFDNYAVNYEKHMLETLHYTVPNELAKLLHHLMPHSSLTTPSHPLTVTRTLDLGCGTGLSGVVLKELSDHLTGVDLSVNMLNEAKRKGIYDELIEMDLLVFLANTIYQYALIVAADVLPYLGNLEGLFQSIHRTLYPGGLFVLTTEISTTGDWQLQKTARFAHHPDYIQTLSEQYHFDIAYKNVIMARQQHGESLPVMLYALTKQT